MPDSGMVLLVFMLCSDDTCVSDVSRSSASRIVLRLEQVHTLQAVLTAKLAI